MKTETLTIRLSREDKQLLQTAARARGLTIADYLLCLVRSDARSQTADDLRAQPPLQQKAITFREIAEHSQRKRTGKQVDPLFEQVPGQTKDCNPSCRWFCNGTCDHPLYEDWKNVSILGDCPNYDPQQ